MDNYTYLDVYAKTFLNEIKERIRWNKIQLSGDKEKETDEFMTDVIKGLCIKPRHNLSDKESYVLKVLPTDSKEDSERIFYSLMLYYVALYNDNIELLNKLLEHGYNFGYKRHELNLFILDKRISSQFDINLYIELIKTQAAMFKDFYLSLEHRISPVTTENTLTDEEIIKKFGNILNKNPHVSLSKKRKTYYESNPYEIKNLLTKASLSYFDEDIILNATEEQKENIISNLNRISLTKKAINRLINLMTNHEFSTDIYPYWNEVLEELTDYELIQIDSLDKDLFRDVYYDINSDILKKGINKDVALYIQKVRESLNKTIKKDKGQELIKASPKRRLLQRFKTK